VAGRNELVRPRRSAEAARSLDLRARSDAATLGGPLRKAAIEESACVMPQPTEKPPESACIHPGVLVVDDHLRAVVDPESAERLGQTAGVGQRMPSVRPGFRTREIVVHAREDGAGDV